MDLFAGIGLFFAILAIAAPITPGFQNGWVVAGIWFGLLLYIYSLILSHWSKIAQLIASHPIFSAIVMGTYAFFAAAGAWHSYVIPLAITKQVQPDTPTQEAFKSPSNIQSPFIGRLHNFYGSNHGFWWMDANGSWRSRVQVLAYFKVVNISPTPFTVEAIGIEIQDGDETWHKLVPFPNGSLFWTIATDVARARELHGAILTGSLLGRRLQQNEGAEGWMLLHYEKKDGPTILRHPVFRLALRDNTATSYVIDNIRAANYSPQGNEFKMSGDVANFTVGNIRDISKVPELR
jgi:hypothetical protein